MQKTKERNLFLRFLELFFDAGEEDGEQGEDAQRSIPLSRIGEQLWSLLIDRENETGDWAWPVDIYFEDGSLFAIVAQAGRLFQVPLTLTGQDVTMGDWVQVEEQFAPVGQSRMMVTRQADGRYRWTMIAASAVLNRVGEIDSRALFDSFIAYATRTGNYPRLDFYHLGGAGEEWEFGTADYLARDGYLYIASGLFDEDNPLSQATRQAVERSPGTWGASIEFRALGEPELISADPQVFIPVYTEGINTRISVVMEADAAGLFTTLATPKEIARMDARILEKLRELYGDDEDGLNAFVATVDTTNRTIEDKNLIARSNNADQPPVEDTDGDQDTDQDAETPATRQADPDEAEQPVDVVLDDDTMAIVARAVVESDAFAQQLAAIGQVAGLVEAVEAIRTGIEDMGNRLSALEADEDDKRREWANDLPARRQVKVSYRPRDVHRTDDGDKEPQTMEDQAAAIVASKAPLRY